MAKLYKKVAVVQEKIPGRISEKASKEPSAAPAATSPVPSSRFPSRCASSDFTNAERKRHDRPRQQKPSTACVRSNVRRAISSARPTPRAVKIKKKNTAAGPRRTQRD